MNTWPLPPPITIVLKNIGTITIVKNELDVNGKQDDQPMTQWLFLNGHTDCFPQS